MSRLRQTSITSHLGYKDCSQYHRWRTDDARNVNPHARFFHSSTTDIVQGLEATICVKREPTGICLTMPDLDVRSELDQLEGPLSCWHSSHFKHHIAPKNAKSISRILTYAKPTKEVFEHLTWDQFFAVLTPVWMGGMAPWTKNDLFFLGSVVTRPPGSPAPSSPPVAYIPNCSPLLIKPWTLGSPPKSNPGHLYESDRNSEWQR